MTLYEKLKEEFEAQKTVPSILGYTTLYEGKPELEKIYESGYYDGLDSMIGRNYTRDMSLSKEKRMAYAHGLFTGGEELWNDVGE